MAVRTTANKATSVQAPARASSQVKTIPKTGALWVVASTAPAPGHRQSRHAYLHPVSMEHDCQGGPGACARCQRGSQPGHRWRRLRA